MKSQTTIKITKNDYEKVIDDVLEKCINDELYKDIGVLTIKLSIGVEFAKKIEDELFKKKRKKVNNMGITIFILGKSGAGNEKEF